MVMECVGGDVGRGLILYQRVQRLSNPRVPNGLLGKIRACPSSQMPEIHLEKAMAYSDALPITCGRREFQEHLASRGEVVSGNWRVKAEEGC